MASRGWAGVLLVLGAAACGQAFSAGTGGSASSSSSTSTGAGGHASSSSGVSSTSSSSASSSGAAACGSCGNNDYCDTSNQTCKPCSDLSRFEFAAPVKLTVPLPNNTGTARFPRMASDGTLYFAYALGLSTMLASASYDKYPTWNAAEVMGTPPNPMGTPETLAPLPVSSAPLLAMWGAPSSGELLLFDGLAMGSAINRAVFAWQLGQGSMPVPLMLPGAPPSASRIAVATGTQRYFWLASSTLTTFAAGDPEPASVAVNLDDSAPGSNLEPWVTPDGTVLLLSATPSGALSPHLYFARLNGNGQVNAGTNAQRIFTTTDDDEDPSLTTNACALLFTRAGSVYGAFRD